MTLDLAHVDIQGQSCAIFAADARDRSGSGRRTLLAQLTHQAQRDGLRVDKAALVFQEYGQTQFFGTPDLVNYLSRNGGVGRWTHRITV